MNTVKMNTVKMKILKTLEDNNEIAFDTVQEYLEEGMSFQESLDQTALRLGKSSLISITDQPYILEKEKEQEKEEKEKEEKEKEEQDQEQQTLQQKYINYSSYYQDENEEGYKDLTACDSECGYCGSCIDNCRD